VTRDDDDGSEPPRRVHSERPPAERAPTPPRKPAPRRDAPPPGTRSPQPSTPTRATSPRGAAASRASTRQRPRADNSEEFWGTRFDDNSRSGPEPSRRQRAARRDAASGGRRRRRRRTILVLLVVLLPVVLVLGAGGWFLYQVNPPGDPGRRISLTIPERTGTGGIGDLLEDKGVIGSSTAFQIYTKITRAGPFKPGQYSMREDLGVRDAVKRLNAGPARAPDARLDLAPGLSFDQIADRVGQLPGHSRDDFLAAAGSTAVRSKYQPADVTSLEGLMFPDTYSVKEDETDEQILARLVAAFDQQADGAGVSAANVSGLSPYQTIVAASLIEREAKLDEDRPLIAAVIRNRLAAGMPLQIDATVCYAKGGCDQAPTRADLAIDSPYNTYKVQGLPPTPISSVSVKSLIAAATPADAPYLFYVLSDNNGKHKFASTPEEHDRNVEEARQKGLL
jgi:UPF0755 protein